MRSRSIALIERYNLTTSINSTDQPNSASSRQPTRPPTWSSKALNRPVSQPRAFRHHLPPPATTTRNHVRRGEQALLIYH